MHACLAGVVLSQFYLLQGFLVQYHLIHTYYDEADDIYYIYGFASLWLYFFLYINHLVHACLESGARRCDILFVWSCMWVVLHANNTDDFDHFLLLLLQREIKESKDTYSMCWRSSSRNRWTRAGHSTHKPVVVHTHTTHCNTSRQAYRGRNGRHIALHAHTSRHTHACACVGVSVS